MKLRNSLIWMAIFSCCVLRADALNPGSSLAPVSARNDSTKNNSVIYNKEADEYNLGYKDDSIDLIYNIKNNDSSLLRGMISVRVMIGETERIIPIYQGGAIIRDASGKDWLPAENSKDRAVRLISHEIKDNGVLFQFEEIFKDQSLSKAYKFSISGKTLIIHATGVVTNSTSAYYAGFDIGKNRLISSPKIINFPSIPLPVTQINDKYFFSTYVDPLLSSTGHYEMTAEIDRRAMQVSNTPAWLVADASGIRQPLDVVSYLTISNHVTDVLPSVSTSTKGADSIRDKVIVDIDNAPFAQYSLAPVETIRRWEVPESGNIKLKGVFQLQGGDFAVGSVVLLEAKTDRERVLFSQVLDSSDKKAAGMEGDFPIEKGDQLLFTVSGSAIMDGGQVVLDVELVHNNNDFSSYRDFSNIQGENGWYYEQRLGADRRLMVWNAELTQWQSPFTRSFQNSSTLVCRSGYSGDVYKEAGRFFDQLHGMGLSDLAFLVRGWSDYARLAPSPAMRHSSEIWGASVNLLEITRKEKERHNLVIPVVETKQIGLPDPATLLNGQSIANLQFLLFKDDLVGTSVEALHKYITDCDRKMHRSGLMLDAPLGFDQISHSSLYYKMLGLKIPSSNEAALQARKHISSIKKFAGEPLLLAWNDLDARFDMYSSYLFGGIAASRDKMSNMNNLVDEDIRCGRLVGPRIGFGSYETFYQKNKSNTPTDVRLFPLDQYMTSTLAFGRAPMISGDVWFPGFNARDMRRYLMETIVLIQPVAREYLNRSNDVVKIGYYTEIDVHNEMSVDEVLLKNLEDKAVRVRIQYTDGLEIFANRCTGTWNIEGDDGMDIVIARDGFLARNAKTGLFSLIGALGDGTFSMQSTAKSDFLHSRDGNLIRGGKYSTDGMMHRWANEHSSHRNTACLAVTEVNQLEPLTPILRSNKRIDCSIHWISNEQVSIDIMKTDDGPILLEYFDAPQLWLENEGKNLSIQRLVEGSPDAENPVNWYIAASNSRSGIRFTDIQQGEQYVITYKAVVEE